MSAASEVRKKKDGLLLVDHDGGVRFMTWRERVAYWLLRGRTEMRASR